MGRFEYGWWNDAHEAGVFDHEGHEKTYVSYVGDESDADQCGVGNEDSRERYEGFYYAHLDWR